MIKIVAASSVLQIEILEQCMGVKNFLTSFPLVSPLSNHSTVTLLVSKLIPDTTAEWMRPEDKKQAGNFNIRGHITCSFLRLIFNVTPLINKQSDGGTHQR